MLINVEGEKERIPRSGQVERSLDSALSKGREREDSEAAARQEVARSLARSLATLAALPFEPRFVMVRMIDEGSGSLHRRHVALRASPPIYTVSSLYTHRGRTPCAIPSFPPNEMARFLPSFLPSLRFSNRKQNPKGKLRIYPLSRSGNSFVPILVEPSLGSTDDCGKFERIFHIYIYIYGIITESSNNQFPSCGEMSGKMQGFET